MLGRRRSEGPVPIRGALLRPEGFEERAEVFAAVSTLLPASRGAGRGVLPRLEDSLHALTAAHRSLAEDVHRWFAVPPAAEWLLDNFHLVEAEALAVRHDLPARSYHKRPMLAAGEVTGRTRIHALTLELIRHSGCAW